MIPTNHEIIKSWDQFEGASTYEYAQNKIKLKKLNHFFSKKIFISILFFLFKIYKF